jgi:dipeptidyl aminopeptidase/acylaminoacyl peptidase
MKSLVIVFEALALTAPLKVPAGAATPLPVEKLLAMSSVLAGETPQWAPDGSRILLASSWGGGGLMTLSPEGGFPRPLPLELGGAGHFLASQMPGWSPDGKWVSYVSDKSGSPEIWLWSTEDGRDLKLTALGGRINALGWSADSRWIALSGDRNGNYDIWKVSVPAGDVYRLTSAERNEVFPTWTPDGSRIVYVELDERWVDHRVVVMGADGTNPRTVVQDTDFFDYRAGGTFGYPVVSPDGSRVLFRSHRRGWINYWTVALSGGEPRAIAAEEADQSHARWSKDGSAIAYVSNHNGTHELRVVPAAGGAARVLVKPERGVVADPEWSPDGTRLSYTLSRPTRPADLFVLEVKSGATRQLTDSLPAGNLEKTLVAPEKVSYRSEEFTINAYLYKPASAAAGERFPGVLWIHGGPTSQFNDVFEPHVQFFVQRGYVVLLPNIRGSSGYGKAFEDANNRCWGHCDLKDVLAGVDYLKKLPYVNPHKMGISGTSYGGIMSMAAAAFAPGVFQAAIPASGYGDWMHFRDEQELRHVKLLEYEFGPFEGNEHVYRKNSSIYSVEQITTPMFLIHGEGYFPRSDASLEFARALEKNYKVFRYKAYPNENYYVRSRANRRQMLSDMLEFFDQFLKDKVRTEEPTPTNGNR